MRPFGVNRCVNPRLEWFAHEKIAKNGVCLKGLVHLRVDEPAETRNVVNGKYYSVLVSSEVTPYIGKIMDDPVVVGIYQILRPRELRRVW